jgi:hypothetical protein
MSYVAENDFGLTHNRMLHNVLVEVLVEECNEG